MKWQTVDRRYIAVVGGVMERAYVAVFCPNCGIHLNDFDTQDSPDTKAGRTPDIGSWFTCGWCQLRTCDWSHVAECRSTWPARQALAEAQALEDRREVRARLSRMVTDLEAGVRDE